MFPPITSTACLRLSGRMEGIEVLLFDVFGTVVDWRSSVYNELKRRGNTLSFTDQDWHDFANEWRQGYLENTCVHPL